VSNDGAGLPGGRASLSGNGRRRRSVGAGRGLTQRHRAPWPGTAAFAAIDESPRRRRAAPVPAAAFVPNRCAATAAEYALPRPLWDRAGGLAGTGPERGGSARMRSVNFNN